MRNLIHVIQVIGSRGIPAVIPAVIHSLVPFTGSLRRENLPINQSREKFLVCQAINVYTK